MVNCVGIWRQFEVTQEQFDKHEKVIMQYSDGCEVEMSTQGTNYWSLCTNPTFSVEWDYRKALTTFHGRN